MNAGMRRKVRAALRRGKARIADPNHWIQGSSMQDEEERDADDAAQRDIAAGDEGSGKPVLFCAAGALDVDRASGEVVRLAMSVLDRAALALDPSLATVHGSAAAAYNDARTHAEVLVMYDVALAIAGEPRPVHDCDFCRSTRRTAAEPDATRAA